MLFRSAFRRTSTGGPSSDRVDHLPIRALSLCISQNEHWQSKRLPPWQGWFFLQDIASLHIVSKHHWGPSPACLLFVQWTQARLVYCLPPCPRIIIRESEHTPRSHYQPCPLHTDRPWRPSPAAQLWCHRVPAVPPPLWQPASAVLLPEVPQGSRSPVSLPRSRVAVAVRPAAALAVSTRQFWR